MGYRLLAGADLIAFAAMVAILGRIFVDYQEGRLTAKSLLVGGFLFAILLGLFAAGIQTLVRGPGL